MWPVYVPPQPEPPDWGESQTVERHAGMWCGCRLLNCCHSEIGITPWNHGSHGPCHDSGNPATDYLYPWEPGDESWREQPPWAVLLGVAERVWFV